MGCFYSTACIGTVPHTPNDPRIKEGENVKAAAGSFPSPVSSDVQDGEIGDQLNQLSISRDSEMGMARLSRVSSQFLPPDGYRIIKVPSGNYELKYSYLSQRGYYPEALDKANQDNFCIHTPVGSNLDDHFFGVFDGHGEFGAQCSQFVKQKLSENLLRNTRFHMDAVEACHAAILATNSQLHSDSLDDSMSGTTTIMILVWGRTLNVANSGDSRVVIAERRGKDIVAVDLSNDQTPFRADELERVKLCGARVLTLDQIEGLKNPDVQFWGTEEGDDGDPPRLWVQNGMYPGTAFTRSIGDSIAETIGVVATPETVVLELTPDHPFFVIASDDKNGGVPRVLQRYTAEKLSSFGELALMYNKPLQDSVHAVTSGTLWALKREVFRGILISKFSDLSSLRLLRSVELLSRLTILQLSHIADSLSEVSLSDGQMIVDKNQCLSALYIIQKGQVRVTYDMDLNKSSPDVCGLSSTNSKQPDNTEATKEISLEKTEGSYFGEWVLLGEHIGSLRAVAVGDVIYAVVTKEKFESVVGHVTKLSQEDHRSKNYSLSSSMQSYKAVDVANFAKVQLADLEWQKCVYSTDCSEIGLVLLRGSENMLSLKRFLSQRIKQLGKELHVLKEKDLMKSLSPSLCVPQILCTFANQTHAGILLNACLACPLASILHSPLNETSGQFCATSVILAIEELHKVFSTGGVGVPDVLMFNRTDHLQVVDFRFGKKIDQ